MKDARGLDVSTDDAAAVTAVDDFAARLLRLDQGVEAILDAAKRWPATPIVQLYAAAFWLYGQTEDLSNDIRQLSHDLHPATLEHLGLADALASHINEFQNDEGVPTSFTCRLPSEGISFEVSVCLYRIALEALRNIAKHARAKSVAVRLTEDEEFVTLEVDDSGVGFDVETAKRGSGLGLLSAEERANLLQGTFDVNSTLGQGTKLTVRVPLQ